jgi:UDP-N-acetylenolpyruvoylglucosamine reductase
MNAGCHGGQWADVLVAVTVAVTGVSAQGPEVRTIPAGEIPFSYRRCGPEDDRVGSGGPASPR